MYLLQKANREGSFILSQTMRRFCTFLASLIGNGFSSFQALLSPALPPGILLVKPEVPAMAVTHFCMQNICSKRTAATQPVSTLTTSSICPVGGMFMCNYPLAAFWSKWGILDQISGLIKVMEKTGQHWGIILSTKTARSSFALGKLTGRKSSLSKMQHVLSVSGTCDFLNPVSSSHLS